MDKVPVTLSEPDTAILPLSSPPSVNGVPIVMVGMMWDDSVTERSLASSELVLASESVSVMPMLWPEFHSSPASITMLVSPKPMEDVVRCCHRFD